MMDNEAPTLPEGEMHSDARSLFSTRVVDPSEAFDYWRDLISATFVQLTAQPLTATFAGSIDRVAVRDLDMTSVVASGQDVRRTKSLIASSSEEFVLASIQVSGQGRVEQDGRVAVLDPGDMAFYDSSRPYRLVFDGAFEQLVVQVSNETLARATGLRPDFTEMTARSLSTSGCGPVVASFFRSFSKAAREDADSSRVLHPHALGLLAAAAVSVAGASPTDQTSASVNRQRVTDYVSMRFTDPLLDVDSIARGLGMSRRTVHRALEAQPGGLTHLVRWLRVERAKLLLLNAPTRPIASIAGASGFLNEASFYRTFRRVAGVTPGEFRANAETGANRK